jgi:hypothetical protein
VELIQWLSQEVPMAEKEEQLMAIEIRVEQVVLPRAHIQQLNLPHTKDKPEAEVLEEVVALRGTIMMNKIQKEPILLM